MPRTPVQENCLLNCDNICRDVHHGSVRLWPDPTRPDPKITSKSDQLIERRITPEVEFSAYSANIIHFVKFIYFLM